MRITTDVHVLQMCVAELIFECISFTCGNKNCRHSNYALNDVGLTDLKCFAHLQNSRSGFVFSTAFLW